MTNLENGTNVLVSPLTPSGKPKQPYRGVVAGRRDGVKCLGSVEYLITSEGGSQRYEPASFLTVLQPDKTTGAVKGRVSWFDDAKGYGMLALENYPNPIFVHYSAIQGEGFKTLTEGEAVKFDLIEGPKGPQAANVYREIA